MNWLLHHPLVSLHTCVALLTLVCGCGGGYDTGVVEGRVTYRGEPLEKGQIRFIPHESSATWVSGAYIVDGEYRVDTKGGVPVGKHNVEIMAQRPTADYLQRNGPPGPDALWDHIPKEQYLPAKYNTQTELQMTVESDSCEVVKDFDLTD